MSLFNTYLMGMYLGQFFAGALMGGSIPMIIFFIKRRPIPAILCPVICGLFAFVHSIASIVVGIILVIIAIIIKRKNKNSESETVFSTAEQSIDDYINNQELRAGTPIMILTVSFLIIDIFFNINSIINIITVISDYSQIGYDGYSGNQSYLFIYGSGIVLWVGVYVLFGLYMLFFRKKMSGAILLPIIYLLLAIRQFIFLIDSFSGMIDSLNYYYSSEYLVTDIIYNTIDLLMLAAYIIMIIVTWRGLPNKPLLITANVILISYQLYNLMYFVITQNGYDFSVFGMITSVLSYLAPILLYTALMIYGLTNKTPPIPLVMKYNTDVRNTKAAQREAKLIEQDLSEIEARHSSGLMTQEEYENAVSSIQERKENISQSDDPNV